MQLMKAGWFSFLTGCLLLPLISLGEQYTVTDIGSLGGAGSQVMGINNSGQIVGTSRISPTSYQHAFLYTNGVMTDLTPGTATSAATSISDNGKIAVSLQSGSPSWQAFLKTTTGGSQPLGTLGGLESYALGVNNAGQVVGWSEPSTSSSANDAFVVGAGGISDLGTFGGHTSVAHLINNNGLILAIRDETSSNARVYAIDTQSNTTTDLVPYSANGTIAMNNVGQYAFGRVIYSLKGAAPIDIGTLGGSFTQIDGINDLGMAVGISNTATNQQHAFVYANGVMQDLTLIPANSGLKLTEAVGINNSGQIAGNAQGEGFLLTPVPEPTVLAIWPPVLMWLLGRRKQAEK